MRIGTWVPAFVAMLTVHGSSRARQPIIIELRKNGEFQLPVGSTQYNTDSTAKWEFDSKDPKISFAPSSTNTVILMRGKVDHYLQSGKKVSFEFTLKEANRMPVKAGTMLILER